MGHDSRSSSGERSAAQRSAIVLAAVLQVLVTALPGLGLGEPIGERSDAARTLITPAGWAFSIWGPLYAGSFAYAIYQALGRQRDNVVLARIGWASAGAFLGNAAWALYTQFLGLNFGSVVIILFTLACLLHVYRVLAGAQRPFSAGEKLVVVLPLSALCAWLTAAAIVNVAASLTYHGLDAGEAAPLLGAGVILIGSLITAAALWRGQGNPWFALVFLWALAAVFASGGQTAREIGIAAIAGAALVAATAAVRLTARSARAHWFAAAQ